jgi:hypothetical protein
MSYVEEIITALLLLGTEDLENARRYLRWMQLRRQINDRFYFAAHWIETTPRPHYHWVGHE